MSDQQRLIIPGPTRDKIMWEGEKVRKVVVRVGSDVGLSETCQFFNE